MRAAGTIALVVGLLLSPALFAANETTDLYVIPVAGHLMGVGGSNWMSDISIQNFQATPLAVGIVVIESGASADNVAPLQTPSGSAVTIPPNGTRILRDVLAGHRGLSETAGAILIGADKPFAVASRTYVVSPSGATQGQSVMPVRDFLDNSLGHVNLADAAAYVPGLTANARYRTNLGFVAGSSSSSGLMIEVMLRGADGTSLGSRMFTVSGGSFMHAQFSSAAITSATFDEGSATYRIVAGSGAVVPYASIVDNLSQAAFYVSGQFASNTASGKSVFRALLQRVDR